MIGQNMNGAELITSILISKDITNVFGLPGSTTLDFLYAFKAREKEISVHLNYSEFASGYAALGYGQISDKPGVIYTSRGPGFTNIITIIADAYYDSIPLIVLTAHTYSENRTSSRVDYDQEIYCEDFVSNHVKYLSRVESSSELEYEILKAIDISMRGRKGPVVIDVNKKILSQKVDNISHFFTSDICETESPLFSESQEIQKLMNESKRPVLLVGGGARSHRNEINSLAIKYNIPIISSRSSQSLFKGEENYFGFIGSHGSRYANFILSKADIVISLGNRLSFPINSKSYSPLMSSKKFIRVELDNVEFSRVIPNSLNLVMSIKSFLNSIIDVKFNSIDLDWINLCRYLKSELKELDNDFPINLLVEILNHVPKFYTSVVDVGNNTFWIANAYEKSTCTGEIFYSRSFSVMGSAFPKSIGIYYASKTPVIAFVGDLGIQSVIGELQFLSVNKIPIKLFIINNQSSGMVRDNEMNANYSDLIHTTNDSGYFAPNFNLIASSYGLNYYIFNGNINSNELKIILSSDGPAIVEVIVNSNPKLIPTLDLGSPIQDLSPKIDREKFLFLDQL